MVETGSLNEYASRMLFLPGVEPPFCVAKSQLPGSFSLPSFPPAKMLSLRFGSGLWLTGETFCQSVLQRGARRLVAVTTLEGGARAAGSVSPASGTASARAAANASAPSAAKSEMTRTSSSAARIMRAAGTEPCMRE